MLLLKLSGVAGVDVGMVLLRAINAFLRHCNWKKSPVFYDIPCALVAFGALKISNTSIWPSDFNQKTRLIEFIDFSRFFLSPN